MIKVNMIFSNNMMLNNGLVAVIESFIYGEHFLKDNDIEIENIFVPAGNYNRNDVLELKKQRCQLRGNSSKKKKYRKYIKRITTASSLLSFAYIMKFFRNGRKAVNNYFAGGTNEDVLLFNEVFSAYAYFKKTNKHQRTKTILTIHSDGETFGMIYKTFPKLNKLIFKKYLDKIEKICVENADVINFVSKKSKDKFLENNPSYEPKVTYIYNGIEDFKYKRPSTTNDKIRIISVGSVCYRKGQDLIIDAISQIDTEVKKNIEISFVGAGPNYEEYMEKVAQKGLEDTIKFLGIINNVKEILNEYEGFILASRDEGLPIAIIEALREGLPIFATNVGGNSELVISNGKIIEPTMEEVKKIIEWISNNRENLSEMGKLSRDLFEEKFTLDKMLNNYAREINILVNTNKEKK